MDEHRCFCELAPLYALGLLNEGDLAWVETQIVADQDLATELAEIEAIVAAIPYGIHQVQLPANLKDRLFQRIGRTLPPVQSVQESASAFPSLVARLLERSATSLINRSEVRHQAIKWERYKVPGVTIARLHIDLVKREAVGLFRAEPGVRYPLHYHADVEEIFMLQGDLIMGNKVYGSGDYIRSVPSSTHAPETHGGCMFFFRTSLHDEILEEAQV
ncbi:cupin domain-containing protein [Phormidium sp. CLA17]|uniref:cupin domain-containing protein n=1 Tax=Leptolyngbya sp. Cla-17 TaxID=2803751 RepID=UPI001492E1D2|nr:cupin domain-containing protein [Leptolyngbya sp. Cla-17]MBM0742364.1 cupin domain-containing protein [Leptolyngbya sp. Cla-17]